MNSVIRHMFMIENYFLLIKITAYSDLVLIITINTKSE